MKQIDNILAEVNYPINKIKLVKCVGAHNEAGWIEYVLRNNYDEFDVIRVVEGAVEGRPNSTHDGHSTDNTVELIKNFPDPDNKIELYQLGRPFKSLEEQKQVFLDVAKEDEWLFIVDADEFYLEGDVAKIRKAILSHPAASEMIPTFLHFYRDFWHVKAPEPEWQPQHQRIFRYRPGMRYHTHPVVTLGNGVCSYFAGEMQPSRYVLDNINIFHYGHAKHPDFHKMKAKFYQSELKRFEGRGGNAAAEFDMKLDEFCNFKEKMDSILEYTGPHPDVLKSHKQYSVREPFYTDKAIKNWKQDAVYGADRLPTIAVWMMDNWGTKRAEPFYNSVKC